MKPLITALGVYLNDLPYFLLCVAMLRDYLRIPIRRAWGIMLMLSTAHALSIIALMLFYENWDSIRLIHDIFFLLLFVGAVLYGIELRPLRLLFAVFLVKFYADVLTSTAKFIELSFWPEMLGRSFSLQFTLMQLALLILTYPPILIFVSRKLRPLFQIESPIWRYLWLIPGIFYVLHIAYTAMNSAIIHNVQYVVFSSFLFISALLICLLIQDFLQTERTKQQLLLQQEHYAGIMQTDAKIKTMRHDIRHQLLAVQGYLDDGNPEGARRYCETLLGEIPTGTEWTLCPHLAVNAVASHSLSKAKSAGVRVDALLAIPEDLGSIREQDLCVVLGNLLENAERACRRVRSGERFITLRGEFRNGKLYITLDNSYDSAVRTEGTGIGLLSVRAVAGKYGGLALFEPEDGVFKSSVMLDSTVPAGKRGK